MKINNSVKSSLIEEYIAGSSLSQVGEKFGVTAQAVYYILKRASIIVDNYQGQISNTN